MRRTLATLLTLALTTPAFAEDCTKDVLAAFEKQRTSKAFRVAMTQPTAEGPVDMTVDYLPPDKMLQTVVGKHMPGEQQTMLVGDRAFAGSSGAFEELQPHLTQSIVSEVRAALDAPPSNLGTYLCVGKQTFDGKEYVAYRTQTPEPVAADAMARTIYVDAASGLPMLNIVAKASNTNEPVVKVTYSYPTDIEIVAPVGAPVHKSQ
ncbi:MAG: hypothetical protein CTY31_07515 [Hyphomicrobium sp.]|nr:MAG: hypothetical protein CTY39_08245 [Hyphomicrobium sp.]PPC99750.1 MAG: hypothetical protein CTY31_07515 [Hyphomicrobium sp.]